MSFVIDGDGDGAGAGAGMAGADASSLVAAATIDVLELGSAARSGAIGSVTIGSGADNACASCEACGSSIAGISCKVGATPEPDVFLAPCFKILFDCFFLVKRDGSVRLSLEFNYATQGPKS